jgi:hypothetical protein
VVGWCCELATICGVLGPTPEFMTLLADAAAAAAAAAIVAEFAFVVAVGGLIWDTAVIGACP